MNTEYWDIAVEQQTEDNVPKRVIKFLQKKTDELIAAPVRL